METANNIHYTEAALRKIFNEESPLIKTEILWEALGFKDLYRILSRWECIYMAMGYHNTNTISEGEILWKKSR